jgi:hypothetical protein
MLFGTRRIRVKTSDKKKDDKKISDTQETQLRKKREENIDEMIDEVIDGAAMMQPLRSVSKKNQVSAQEAEDSLLTVTLIPLESFVYSYTRKMQEIRE